MPSWVFVLQTGCHEWRLRSPSRWFNAEALVRIFGGLCHHACEADFPDLQRRGLTGRIYASTQFYMRYRLCCEGNVRFVDHPKVWLRRRSKLTKHWIELVLSRLQDAKFPRSLLLGDVLLRRTIEIPPEWGAIQKLVAFSGF